jgi:hypothetical protein
MMVDHVVTINMDQKCAECGKGGAVPNGLCLKCTTKACFTAKPLKSDQAQAVRLRQLKRAAERP